MEMFLTTLKFGSLMDANLRGEPRTVDGFPTNAASARKETSPAMAQAVGTTSEVCRALYQPFFRSLSIRGWRLLCLGKACCQHFRSEVIDSQSALGSVQDRCSPERSALRNRFLHLL
jgi:hypothetical protein